MKQVKFEMALSPAEVEVFNKFLRDINEMRVTANKKKQYSNNQHWSPSVNSK